MLFWPVYVLLAVAVFSPRDARSACEEFDCSCVAFVPLSKNLACETECEAENVVVEWNMFKDDNANNINITFILEDGVPSFINHLGAAGQEHITREMRVIESRDLQIDKVSLSIHDSRYTCKTFYDDNSRTPCGVTFSLTPVIITLFKTLDIRPELLYTTDVSYYGTRKILCVDGDSPGIFADRSSWEKTNVTHEITVDITSECTTCTSCSDLEENYGFFNLPSVIRRLEMNYKYSAFVVTGKFAESSGKIFSECMSIPNRYISFLVISEVTDEATGDWEITMTSDAELGQSSKFNLDASYKQIETTIEPLPEVAELNVMENGYVICNASHTIGIRTQLLWEPLGDDSKSVAFITNTTVVGPDEIDLSNVYISQTQLNHLCSEFDVLIDSETVAVSLNYAPNELLHVKDEEGALIQQRLLVLLLCNVGGEQVGLYNCMAPSTRQEQDIEVKVFYPSSPEPIVVNGGAIAGVVIAALIIIIMMIVLVIFGIRRYRLLKYEAMHMRPMTIPLAVTQLTTAINHTFSTLSPIGSPMYNKFEFPRENLILLEVIGEGQFGQVWRARAIGICNEDSRNIVAVKTLKENFRDADYYDLRSELDIMRSMEPHPNIINLLGVCSEIDSRPMCILMEYAAYGSMKDYLAYCRRVMQAHAQGLPSPTLEEAYPSAAASNGAIIRQSMLMGEYPQLTPLGHPGGQWEGNDYNYDPMVASRTRRLLQMLKLEGYKPTEEDETYNHLAASGGGGGGASLEAAGMSLYDRLYPQSQCVYRPCLEAFNYACYRGAQNTKRGGNVEQEYYNSLAGGEELAATSDGRSSSPPPPLSPRGMKDTFQLIESSPAPQVEITDSETQMTGDTTSGGVTAVADPNTTPVKQKKKNKVGLTLSLPHQPSQERPHNSTSLSASQDNVFESPENVTTTSNLLEPTKEYMRESMISFPDGYIYAQPDAHSVSEMNDGLGEREVIVKKEKEPAPLMEDMITHLDLLDFALQIARGMDHLQRMQCVHRDLAARNILISEDFTLKIGDFGLARDLSDKDYYRKVTPGRLPARWMAPESLEERTHTFQSDVWSYGVVLWEILSYGEIPYRGQPEANDCDHLAYYLRSGNRLIAPSNTTDEFRDLMSCCWSVNPDKRPSFSEIMSILDNQLSAAHGYLTMACAPVDRERLSQHDQAGSTNPSPLMQKRKAMLQKLDKLHGADRPVSLQPGAFSKSKLAKSPSLPIAEPLHLDTSTGAPSHPPTSNGTVSPYLLPTPTLQVPPSGSSLVRPGSPAKFGSNPELSLTNKEGFVTTTTTTTMKAPEAVDREGKAMNGVKANGVGTHTTLKSIETQL